jgi:hypothetical protein
MLSALVYCSQVPLSSLQRFTKYHKTQIGGKSTFVATFVAERVSCSAELQRGDGRGSFSATVPVLEYGTTHNGRPSAGRARVCRRS